jgi:hypothetical protein
VNERDIKLCRDCRFAIPSTWTEFRAFLPNIVHEEWGAAKCSRVGELNLASGERKIDFCTLARGEWKTAPCGTEARLFEPRCAAPACKCKS